MRLSGGILELEAPGIKGISGELAALDGDVQHPAEGVDALVDEGRRGTVVLRLLGRRGTRGAVPCAVPLRRFRHSKTACRVSCRGDRPSKRGQVLTMASISSPQPAAGVRPNIRRGHRSLPVKRNQGAHGASPAVTSAAVCRSRSILARSSASRILATVQTSVSRLTHFCLPLRVNLP
jgi:hypothetical protein